MIRSLVEQKKLFLFSLKSIWGKCLRIYSLVPSVEALSMKITLTGKVDVVRLPKHLSSHLKPLKVTIIAKKFFIIYIFPHQARSLLWWHFS